MFSTCIYFLIFLKNCFYAFLRFCSEYSFLIPRDIDLNNYASLLSEKKKKHHRLFMATSITKQLLCY